MYFLEKKSYMIIKWLLLLLCIGSVMSVNKYLKEANINFKDHFEEDFDFKVRNLDKPFRMAKLNLLWGKAKIRLSEPKLKSLYSELKLHDKEEIAFKHFKITNDDKDGLQEAELRKKLIGIMSTYDLLEHFQDTEDVQKLKDYDTSPDSYMNKNIFKDKKLNKLWMKSEIAGFNKIELQVLKEEFMHHQDKLDQYYSLLKEAETEQRGKSENSVEENLDRFNTIEHMEEQDPKAFNYDTKIDEIRSKGMEIKDGYDRLERLSAQGPNSKEFVEPRVQNLWKLAMASNFSSDELSSFRTELHHYEKRLLKLRNLHLEAAVGKTKEPKKLPGEKPSAIGSMEDMLKRQARKVEKLHLDLHSKLVAKSEL